MLIYHHAAAERDRLIADGLDAMIAEAQGAQIVAIDGAARKRLGRRRQSGVARVLHDQGAE